MRTHRRSQQTWRPILAGALITACGGGAADGSAGPPPGPTVARVVVTAPVTQSDAVGDTIRFRGEAQTAGGSPVSGVSLVWTVSDETLATITADGLLTTRGNGTVTATASVGGQKGTATVTINQKAVAIRANHDSLVLDRWRDTTSLSANVVDRLGAPVRNAAVQWVSSDTSIAQVSATGGVTTGKGGNVVLTGTVAGNAELRLTVGLRVAVQRNTACRVPSAAIARGAARGPVSWTATPIPGSPIASDSTLVGPIGAPVAIDLDGDGDLDVFAPWYIVDRPATVRTIPGVSAFRNTGSTLVEATSAFWGSQRAAWVYPRIPLLLDANGDGRRDLLLLDTGYDPAGYGGGCYQISPCPGAKNTLLLGNGQGMTDDSGRLRTNASTAFSHSGDVADVDCDGDDDFLEGTWGGPTTPEPSHLQMNTNGNFTADDARLPLDLGRSGWVGVQWCDIDRDGDADGVVSIQGQRVRIMINDGFGKFRLLPIAAIPQAKGGDASTEYAEIRCADFDGDGWNDLVLGRHAASVSGEAFTLLLNNGDATFRDVTSMTSTTLGQSAGDWPWQILVADFNQDGWPDLMMTNPAGAGLSRILSGAGAGRFTEYVFPDDATFFWLSHSKVAVGDFTGDGRPDIYSFRGRYDHALITNR